MSKSVSRSRVIVFAAAMLCVALLIVKALTPLYQAPLVYSDVLLLEFQGREGPRGSRWPPTEEERRHLLAEVTSPSVLGIATEEFRLGSLPSIRREGNPQRALRDMLSAHTIMHYPDPLCVAALTARSASQEDSAAVIDAISAVIQAHGPPRVVVRGRPITLPSAYAACEWGPLDSPFSVRVAVLLAAVASFVTAKDQTKGKRGPETAKTGPETGAQPVSEAKGENQLGVSLFPACDRASRSTS
jgi:hypothetical protein